MYVSKHAYFLKVTVYVLEKCRESGAAVPIWILHRPVTCQQDLTKEALFVFLSCYFRLQHHALGCVNDKQVAHGSVSVNVPQFCAPPAEGVSQVSVMNLNSTGAEASVSHPHERRRTITLPDECRESFHPLIQTGCGLLGQLSSIIIWNVIQCCVHLQ